MQIRNKDGRYGHKTRLHWWIALFFVVVIGIYYWGDAKAMYDKHISGLLTYEVKTIPAKIINKDTNWVRATVITKARGNCSTLMTPTQL